MKAKICKTFLFFSISEQAIVGYLHNLSPMKTSKSNNQYFDLQIQTSNEVYRTVCFSPDKHPLLKRKLESSSPIKIHKYQLKKNERSGENDLILNKRTKIEDQGNPSSEGKNFDKTRSNLHRQPRVNPCCVMGKRYPKDDYWHLRQHQKRCCQGIWRNQVSDTHKA